MPNLDYDPQNPADLLGQPIAVGDFVAWGTTFGRSAALCVCKIARIRFTKVPDGGYDRVECAQHEATEYKLYLSPTPWSTGSHSFIDTRTGESSYGAKRGEVRFFYGKPVMVTLVRNVLKLDPTPFV